MKISKTMSLQKSKSESKDTKELNLSSIALQQKSLEICVEILEKVSKKFNADLDFVNICLSKNKYGVFHLFFKKLYESVSALKSGVTLNSPPNVKFLHKLLKDSPAKFDVLTNASLEFLISLLLELGDSSTPCSGEKIQLKELIDNYAKSFGDESTCKKFKDKIVDFIEKNKVSLLQIFSNKPVANNSYFGAISLCIEHFFKSVGTQYSESSYTDDLRNRGEEINLVAGKAFYIVCLSLDPSLETLFKYFKECLEHAVLRFFTEKDYSLRRESYWEKTFQQGRIALKSETSNYSPISCIVSSVTTELNKYKLGGNAHHYENINHKFKSTLDGLTKKSVYKPIGFHSALSLSSIDVEKDAELLASALGCVLNKEEHAKEVKKYKGAGDYLRTLVDKEKQTILSFYVDSFSADKSLLSSLRSVSEFCKAQQSKLNKQADKEINRYQVKFDAAAINKGSALKDLKKEIIKISNDTSFKLCVLANDYKTNIGSFLVFSGTHEFGKEKKVIRNFIKSLGLNELFRETNLSIPIDEIVLSLVFGNVAEIADISKDEIFKRYENVQTLFKLYTKLTGYFLEKDKNFLEININRLDFNSSVSLYRSLIALLSDKGESFEKALTELLDKFEIEKPKNSSEKIPSHLWYHSTPRTYTASSDSLDRILNSMDAVPFASPDSAEERPAAAGYTWVNAHEERPAWAAAQPIERFENETTNEHVNFSAPTADQGIFSNILVQTVVPSNRPSDGPEGENGPEAQQSI